eukprot:gene6465-7750_t
MTYEIAILEDSEDKLALLWNLEHNPAHILSDPFFQWHMTSSPPNSTFQAEPPAWSPPKQLPSLNPPPATSPPPETPESTTPDVDASPLPPSPSPPSPPVETELSVETSSERSGSATLLILITSGAALGAVALAGLLFHYFQRMQRLKGFQPQVQAQAAIVKENAITEGESLRQQQQQQQQQQTADSSASSLGPLVHTPSKGNMKALPMRMSANPKPHASQFDDRNRIHPSPKGMKHPSLDLLGEYI